MDFIKSPLNYTGGKFKLLPKIMPLFYEAETFIDLFGGGGNVGINSNSEKIIINDREMWYIFWKIFCFYSIRINSSFISLPP